MRRREYLSALVAAGAVGGGVWVTTSSGTNGMTPQTVETLEAPGSEAGTLTVPVPGTVTVVDAFATWCAPCKKQMEALREAHSRFGDRARFVSVTNEAVGETLTRDDIRQWWRDHDGQWTVGLEDEGNVTTELEISGIPFLAIVDQSGEVTWTHQGLISAPPLVERIEAALA